MVLWWVLLGCVLLWCDVVLCYAVLYGRRNLTKNPSLKLSGIERSEHILLGGVSEIGDPKIVPQIVGSFFS